MGVWLLRIHKRTRDTFAYAICRFAESGLWVLGHGSSIRPEIKNNESLPGLIAIDGLIVVPNPAEDRLDAYTIANASDQRSPSFEMEHCLQQEVDLRINPNLSWTPSFFMFVSGGIQRKPVLGGDAALVEINHVDATPIEPASGCAPLKCDIGGKPTMVVGLETGCITG